MAGADSAIRGYEYQFLRTLEYALAGVVSESAALASMSVESPPESTSTGDAHIVDFGLRNEAGQVTLAQVKSGVQGSVTSAADAVRMLLRLLRHDADHYLLITNRGPGAGLQALRSLLRRCKSESLPASVIRTELVELVSQAPRVRDQVPASDDVWWQRFSNVEITLDDREVDEVYAHVRERVREVRHRLDPAGIGWDAAGLITKYLVAEVLAIAAQGPEKSVVTRVQLVDALCARPDELRFLLRRRDWAIHVTPTPPASDVARPKILTQIAEVLSTPVRDTTVPVCVLTGLSGIGKTSVCAAWADDRADAYAAIFWIDASSVRQAELSFSTVAAWCRNEGLTPADIADPRESVFASLAQMTRPWLMVMDNAESFRAIKTWIPTRGHGHVLVTTVNQIAPAGPHVHQVRVGSMTLSEATGLLAQRILSNEPTQHEQKTLEDLARLLEQWPLALELGAAYLTNCLGGLAGVADYAPLVLRSLDDEDSLPRNYPRTVVNAVRLTWERMQSRATDADRLACHLIRFAVFVATRQIPLHLLFACSIVDPRSLMRPDAETGLFRYTSQDPPAGEVVRALKSDSLVTTDEPLCFEDEPATPQTIHYTLSVNEIVQAILRADIVARGDMPDLVSVAGFYVQHWVVTLKDLGREDLALELQHHAVATADYALREGLGDYSLALLWGNTAGLMVDLENYADAVRYLRAERDYFVSGDTVDHVLSLQTMSTLATCLLKLGDHPREHAREAIDLLEQCMPEINYVREKSPDVAAHEVRVALVAARALAESDIQDPRLNAVERTLTDFSAMLPPAGHTRVAAALMDVHHLMTSQRYDKARTQAEALLHDPNVTNFDIPQILSVLTECVVQLQDWDTSLRLVDQFVSAASNDQIRSDFAVKFTRNVGLHALHGFIVGNPQAEELFHAAVAVSDHAEHHGRRGQAGERDLVAVFRAFRSCLRHEPVACAEWLAQVSLNDLDTVDRAGFGRLLHALLSRWVAPSRDEEPGQAPAKKLSAPPPGRATSGQSSEKVVAETPEEMLTQLMATWPLDSMPLVMATMAQYHYAGGQPIREPGEVTWELFHCLSLLGVHAELIPVRSNVVRLADESLLTLQAALARPDEYPAVETATTHLVWSAACGRCADPTVPHQPDLGQALSIQQFTEGPVIIKDPQLAWEDPIKAGRPPLLFFYYRQSAETLDAAAEHARTTAPPGAVVLALQTVIGMNTCGPKRARELADRYPCLRDLLAALDWAHLTN